MNKSKFICLTLCLTLFAAVLCTTSCENKGDTAEIIHPITSTISIDYPKKSELPDIETTAFKIEENSSVLEAIQIYCNVNDMSVNVETTDGTIVGINDLNNGDFHPNRIWQYKVNGQLCADSAGDYVLQDGDVLEWVYKKID